LGGDDLVVHHEDCSLDEKTQEKVIVDSQSCEKEQTELRDKGGKGKDRGLLVFKKLIDHMVIH